MILDYLFLEESRCPFCRQEDKSPLGYCHDCRTRIDRVDFSSYKDEVAMNLTYPLFYNSYLSKRLADFKFRGQTYLYKVFGDLMYEAGIKHGVFDRVDTLVPVPLYKRAYRYRGYNQSYLLAKRIAERSGLAVKKDLVKKIKRTREQNKVSLLERRDNLKDSIEIKEEFYNKKVLIIDDVFTTGATLRSITSAMARKPLAIEALVLASGNRIIF